MLEVMSPLDKKRLFSKDFEILLGEPVVEMLPVRPKLFSHKYIVPYIIDTLYAIFGPLEVLFRAAAIWKGKQKFRPENLIVILELLILMWLAQNISVILNT